MIKIRLNNTDYEFPEGLTVLEAARRSGFSVPSLCHDPALPHYTSCMVCLVKDLRNGAFFASCSVTIHDGMDLDISGGDVTDMRKKALELLLSEHRAECEAPCRLVCPQGYNIPLFNRLLSRKEYEKAVRLTLEEAGTEIACSTCPAYCENACRRKKIDEPVSIRNMKMFIFSSAMAEESGHNTYGAGAEAGTGRVKKRTSGRFNSFTGKLEPSEQAEWLKECILNSERVRDISSPEHAFSESASCMHCDCRASDNCRLRELAQEYEVKDPRGKLAYAPIEKKINHSTGLIFENAKCIKCGLCVRLCESLNEEPALCFINRGFISIISEPLGEEFGNIIPAKTDEVIAICPTGALSKFEKS